MMRSADGYTSREFCQERDDYDDHDEASNGFTARELARAGIGPNDNWTIRYDAAGIGYPVKLETAQAAA